MFHMEQFIHYSSIKMPQNKKNKIYKGKIVSVVNQKGGVGKTTTVINLATAFAAVKRKVLIIDMDPQGNASTGLGLEQEYRDKTIYEVFATDMSASEAVCETIIPGLHLIPSTVDLSAAELDIADMKNREYILKKKLDKIKHNYDYIIIDCPPSLGLLTINSLTASDSILIPLQCEFFALEGLSHLLSSVELVKQNLNSKLRIDGVVLTMYDRRNNLTSQIEDDVRECLGEMVYNTVIPRNVRLSEAPSHGIPAIMYDQNCSGSSAYIRLAKEMIKRNI